LYQRGKIVSQLNAKTAPLIALTALLLFAPAISAAQESYPSRPIKLVFPYVAGSLGDTLARLIAEKLTSKFGQPVIVENRPGASGNIGAEAVGRSAPDGYTLLIAPPPPLAINQSLFPKLAFDPTIFVPVAVIATVPNVLVVHPKVTAATVEELVAYAKAHPDKLSYASTGSGGTPHLTAEMLKARAGIQIVHVPYKGVPPALTDLIGGQVDMMFANLGDAYQHISSGKLKAVAAGSQARFPAQPNLPTMSETLPDFVSDTWFAVAAPPGTSATIASRLSAAIAETVKLPDVAKRLADLLTTPAGSSPAETAAFIKRDSERWRQVIVSAGIKPD
jgi:tripartite-type tricarboxylate transporter receptor subunit TctC